MPRPRHQAQQHLPSFHVDTNDKLYTQVKQVNISNDSRTMEATTVYSMLATPIPLEQCTQISLPTFTLRYRLPVLTRGQWRYFELHAPIYVYCDLLPSYKYSYTVLACIQLIAFQQHDTCAPYYQQDYQHFNK
jgi:hypothetical protein